MKIVRNFGIYDSAPTGSALLDFCRAYASLGDAITEQVDEAVIAYLENGENPKSLAFSDVVNELNVNAIEQAIERLKAVRRGDLGDERAVLLKALTSARSAMKKR